MEATTETTNAISSALVCRLSEAQPPTDLEPDAEHRHLLLQGIAQSADIAVRPVSRRRLFRRSR